MLYLEITSPPPKQTNKKHALHISGCFIQKGLDYFFVSNTLQNFVKKQNQQQQFFSHLNKDMVMFEEDDYRSFNRFFFCAR